MLEKRLHEWSHFVTLTYAPEFYPSDGSVSIRAVQLFLKRLRRRVHVGIRYFVVGEYGDITGRAHYHLVVFGVPGVEHLRPTRKDPDVWKRCECPFCASWRQGGVHVGELTDESSQYMCSYVCKGATRAGDARLAGRAPEFAKMSLRPGIGAGAAEVIKEALIDSSTGELLMGGRIPGGVRFGDGMAPLGRYLRNKVAEKVGVGVVREYERHLRLTDEQRKLQLVSQREERERKRRHHAHQALKRLQIRRSKKGVGL